jgi:hypothetical protein
VAYDSIAEMTKKGLQSLLIAVAVLLSFVGLFVLLLFCFASPSRPAA